MYRKRLAARVRKARNAVSLTRIMDWQGAWPTRAYVAGSGAKVYRVSITPAVSTVEERERGIIGTAHSHCVLDYSPDENDYGDSWECKGNAVAACYHTIQTVIAAMSHHHRRVAVCADIDSAQFQAKMRNGDIIRVVGDNVDNPVFAVVSQ